MLPLLRSFEQEPASLDRKVIRLTPGKKEERHTSTHEPQAGKGMSAGVEQTLFPVPEPRHNKTIPQARIIGDSENVYL